MKSWARVLGEYVFLSAKFWWAWASGIVLDAMSLLAGVPPQVGHGFLALGVLVANFLAFRKVQLELDDLRGRTHPRIVPSRAYGDKRHVVMPRGGLARHRDIWAVHVDFENAPAASHPSCEATRVTARVTWTDAGQEVLAYTGRWGDTQQPSTLPPFSPTVHLSTIDFPIGGKPRELNLAIMHVGATSDFYGFSDETFLHAPTDWQYKAYRLLWKTYLVTVVLRGIDVHGRYEFEVTPSAQGFSIVERTCEPFVK